MHKSEVVGTKSMGFFLQRMRKFRKNAAHQNKQALLEI